MKRTAEQFIGVTLILFSLVTYFYLIPIHVKLEAEEGDMSPAFFPRLSTTFLGIMSCIYLVQAIRPSSPKRQAVVAQVHLREVILGTIFVMAYILGLYFLGFIVSTLILLPTLMLFWGGQNLRTIALFTVSFTLTLWFFFSHVLSVPLPPFNLF